MRLVNWKPFEEAQVRFYPGVNLIAGSNGSGKSSLLEAISFALYGERALPYELTAAIRRGASLSKVRLSFTAPDGNQYSVERVLRLRGPEGAEAKAVSDSAGSRFYHPDGVSTVGTRRVDDEVLEHLGIPARVFLEALNIRQGELRRIVELRGVERGQYLDRLIGISILEDCYSRASELESWSKTSLLGAELREKSLREETRSIGDLEASLEVAREQAAEVNDLLESKRAELSQVTQRVEELKALQVKLASLEAELRQLDAHALSLSSYLEESRRVLRELAEAEREKTVLESALSVKPTLEARRARLERERKALLASFTNPDSLRKELEATVSRLEGASKEIELLPAKLTELDAVTAEKDELEAEYARYGEVAKSYEELTSRSAKLRVELDSLQSTLRNLDENMEKNCPTCLQPITAEYAKRVSAQLAERLHLLEASLASLEQSRSAARLEKELLEEKGLRLRRAAVKAEALRGLVESLRRRMDEAAELEQRKTGLEASLKKAVKDQEELLRLEREAEALTEKLRELDRDLGRLQDLNERLSSRAALEERVRRLDEEQASVTFKARRLRVEQTQLRGSFDQAELDALTPRLEGLKNEVEKLVEESGVLKGVILKLTERLRELREKEALLGSAKSEVEKWRRVAELTSQVRASFRGSQSTLRKQFIDSINVEAEQVFLDIRRKQRLSGLTVEPDYGIYVLEGGARYPLTAYSGGERTLAAIVLRTAIAKTVLGEVPLLIYDEPTEYLDPEHRESLVNWLKDYGEIRQVIVVSNLGDFEDVADNVVRVSMDEDGISIVT
ncbi:MAG: AAA family ATPase [Candidatus Bathyarchaeia archaeon]